MSDNAANTPLHDLAYVETCVSKAIERFDADYKFDNDNTYYHVDKEFGEVVSVTPACLVGQILGDIGVDELMQTQIATTLHNGQSIRDLTKSFGLPIDEAALEFLDQVQQLNDMAVPWHRILEEVPLPTMLHSVR
jgi:hypothetical protein